MQIKSNEFDLRTLPDSFYADPYPTYQLLREQAPVLRCADGSYFLSRHADVRAVYRDAKRFSSDKHSQFAPAFGVESPLFAHHTTSLVFNDPPLHTQVRKAIGNALSDRLVQSMSGTLNTLVGRLLDRAAELGRFDLISDFAAAIPIEIIGTLLRIPAAEREPLRRWSLAILGALEVGLDSASRDAGNEAVVEFLSYLAQLVEQRRRKLRDEDDDIVARLLRYHDAGQGLGAEVLLHQCIFLLNAGHETTTNLIGNGAVLLLGMPQTVEQLRDSPELIESLVEEVLRYESPNQLGNRTTTENVEIGGVHIPQGSVITMCIGSANRDPEVFARAEQFDAARTPNQHLAFGAGIHTCAGLNVARLEGRVALAKLFERFPKLALDGEAQRARRARFRGYVSAPVVTG